MMPVLLPKSVEVSEDKAFTRDASVFAQLLLVHLQLIHHCRDRDGILVGVIVIIIAILPGLFVSSDRVMS